MYSFVPLFPSLNSDSKSKKNAARCLIRKLIMVLLIASAPERLLLSRRLGD